MKKMFIFAALAFGLASCQNETNIFGVDINNEEKAVEFTITATAPEAVETRADANGYDNSSLSGLHNGSLTDHSLRFILEVFEIKHDANGNATGEIVKSAERYYGEIVDGTNNRTAKFSPRLVPGREYSFVVWADFVTTPETDLYYNTANIEAIAVKDATWTAMAEARDAYTGVVTQTIANDNATNINIALTRPFAKVRYVTTDYVALKTLNVIPTTAKVEYTALPAYTFNARTQEYAQAAAPADKVGKIFENYTIASYATEHDEDTAGANVETDLTLFSDYFFAPSSQVVMGVANITVKDQSGVVIGATKSIVTDVPAKRNMLTTVKGNLLTIKAGETSSFTITGTINDGFAEGETIVNIQ